MISKITPDRSKIIIEQDDHVKYWTRHFGVTKDELTLTAAASDNCEEQQTLERW
jgi:Protein of unknown function (DUF3606)